MRVSDKVLKCVVFVGVEESAGFRPLGTGFIIWVQQRQVGFQYIVTAQHVLDSLRNPISIRVNRKEGDARYIKPPRGWYFHPDASRFVDVAVAPILLQPDMFDIAHIPTRDFCKEEFLTARDVGLGEELFYPGLFMHRRGQARNHPIMRFGTLSAMPVEPVVTRSGPVKAYLMEGRSFGGHSGSPVFINFMAPRAYYADHPIMLPHPDQAQAYRLLGLLRGYMKAADTGEYVGLDEPAVEDLWVNSGISTIIPAQDIIETLMQEDLVKQRDEDEKRLLEGIADVPASTTSAASPPSNDENPNHRADFMRLVDVAGRKPAQED